MDFLKRHLCLDGGCTSYQKSGWLVIYHSSNFYPSSKHNACSI
uniref:Uncharacterized protein n=1 Tax=Arundo donax TaxID=35708 RepID=A0A0A9HRN8_ARUDO